MAPTTASAQRVGDNSFLRIHGRSVSSGSTRTEPNLLIPDLVGSSNPQEPISSSFQGTKILGSIGFGSSREYRMPTLVATVQWRARSRIRHGMASNRVCLELPWLAVFL